MGAILARTWNDSDLATLVARAVDRFGTGEFMTGCWISWALPRPTTLRPLSAIPARHRLT